MKTPAQEHDDEEGGADPGRVDRHGERLQRRVHAGLAGSVSQALVSLGYKAGRRRRRFGAVADRGDGHRGVLGAGASANAAKIATDFGATAKALASLPAEHVEVLLGAGSTVVPASPHPDVVNPDADLRPLHVRSPTTARAGGAVTVAANAKYGIPCVY